MSYFAGRWARAHTLVLDRDSTALAVLKELADDFRDDEGCCRIETYRDLALCLGIKKAATVSEAVSRLIALDLLRTSSIYVGRCVVGTRFELVGYIKSEWPETRQGKAVWVEVARARGLDPQSWWPAVDGIRKTDVPRKTDDHRKTEEVCRKTDDPTPKNGIGVCRKTEEGYSEKRHSFTGDIQGHTGNRQGGYVETPRFDTAPPVDVSLEPFFSCTENGPSQKRVVPKTVQEVYQKRDGGCTENGTPGVPNLGHKKNREKNKEENREKKEGAAAPSAPPSRPKRDTKRGTRLTIETLPDEWRAYVEEKAPDLDADLVFEEFHDYWIAVPGARGLKLDWFATFRNHIKSIPAWKRPQFVKPEYASKTHLRDWERRKPQDEKNYDDISAIYG